MNANRNTETVSFEIPQDLLASLKESITVPIRGMKAGTYLVRVQVDGAESLLGTNAAGQYNSPQVMIL